MPEVLFRGRGRTAINFLNPVLLSWEFCSSCKEDLSDYWIMNFIHVSSASMWLHVEYPFLVIPRTQSSAFRPQRPQRPQRGHL